MSAESRQDLDGEGFAPGNLLPGTKYRIVRVVGEGAMGIAYECVKEPGIRCVVKVLRSYLSQDEEQRRRFLIEVRVQAELDHPNIVRVFDYDVLATGAPFFAMELLHGRTLREVLAERQTLPPRVAAKIMQQLLAALACAHEHDPAVVHRDVKPDNIFLHTPKNDESNVKLLDFGVATVSMRNTSIAGTWGYMAPEQLLGQPVTGRTDLYAAAVVLFEMLTGKVPFHTANLDAMAQATLNAPAPRLSELLRWASPALDDAVAAALDKDQARRPATAAAFARALGDLDRDEQGPATPTPRGRYAPEASRTEASLTAIVKAVDVTGSTALAAHENVESVVNAPRPRRPWPSSTERPGSFGKAAIAAILAGGVIGLGGAAVVIISMHHAPLRADIEGSPPRAARPPERNDSPPPSATAISPSATMATPPSSVPPIQARAVAPRPSTVKRAPGQRPPSSASQPSASGRFELGGSE